ncbi:MAG: hypothetical protein U0P81_04330 [Holophagaceae bacterium]
MNARYVYTVGWMEKGLVVLGLASLAFFTTVFLYQVARLVAPHRTAGSSGWSSLLIPGGWMATTGLGLFRFRKLFFRRATLELDANVLTIRPGLGMLSFRALAGSRYLTDDLDVNLEEARLEWAGTTLNLRGTAIGALTLADGVSAQGVADWLSANGHPPARAY